VHPVGSYCTDISAVLNPGRNLCGNIISHSTQEREICRKYDKRVSWNSVWSKTPNSRLILLNVATFAIAHMSDAYHL